MSSSSSSTGGDRNPTHLASTVYQNGVVNTTIQSPSPRSPERTRLHESFQDDRTYLPQMLARDNANRSTRVEALLTLKGSIEKASSAIQSRNASVDKQRREKEAHDAARFDALLRQGQNPYEVTRRRSVQDAARKEREAIERRMHDQQATMLQHLEVEKVWSHRHERIAEEHRRYEKTYQKEMGRAAAEARTTQFLVSRTGKETMDPAGKAFRLYPSQMTTIKDHSFGLGKNLVHDATQRHRIVEKVHRKRVHRDASGADPSEMMLPRVNDTSPNNNNNHNEIEAEIEQRASTGGAVSAATPPGQELEELHHSILHRGTKADTLKASLPPLVDAMAPSKPKKKGFGKPHRSVLEQRLLDQARATQKTNLFQKQIVWGKEFTGRAFLADPPELWFKDFEVGEPMTLSFTLTNVSNTFNQFKLLDLEEAIHESFEIVFEKPGRMSAGMACRIAITFTAIHARDIDSAIPAIAQTGAFSIPLRCTCKKAVPVLETRALVFTDVVAGEKQVRSLTLENRGALPLAFYVRRVKRSRESQEPAEPELDNDEGVDQLEELMNREPAAVETHSQGGAMDPSAVDATLPPTEEILNGDGDAIVTSDLDSGELDSQVVDGEEDGSVSTSSLADSTLDGKETTTALLSQCLALSSDEQVILDHARAATVFSPECADTPIRHTVSGTVAPYASSTIAFTFAPASPLAIDEEIFLIEFPQAETVYRSAFWSSQLLAPMVITVAAHATDVPIFVATPELDFRCCLYDRLYRQQLVVCNRGSVALKVQLRVPKVLDGCLEFHPNMGFVQAATSASASAAQADKDKDHSAGTFPVQIKFRPNAEMWKLLEAKAWGNAATGFLAVPIQVVVPDQVVPVYVVLIARLSPATLSFSPCRLDFGVCALGHSVAHVVAITNTSRLPQKIALVKLPTEIRLRHPTQASANPADDGIATLLPLETKTWRVVYLPSASATTLTSRLVCRTSLNDEYTIPVQGECVATPLVFSHSIVQLGATQLGQRQTYSLSCVNHSDKPQTIELVVPPEATNALRVTPTVATIGPRARLRVEVEFTANEELLELPTSEYATAEKADRVTAPAYSVLANASQNKIVEIAPNVQAMVATMPSQPAWVATKGVPKEERSVHHTWTILCFRQYASSSLVAFQVRTSVVEPKLFALPSELDFGQVAIGQVLIKELTFTNHSVHDVVLHSRALHALGGFRMINSIQRRLTGRGGTHRVKIEFQPLAPLLYDDELELACPQMGVLRVPFRGEGVNPSLRIEPDDGAIDFADVLARSRTVRELVLTNASAFPLTLAIMPVDDRSAKEMTSSGLPVFTFSPSEATIAAQATLVVKVLFFPDHQRPQQYQQQFRIQVPNASERHVLTLSGRCWENQLYVYNPHESPKLLAAPPVEDWFDLPPSVNLASLFSNGGVSLLTSGVVVPGIKKAPAPLTIVFESDTLATESKTVCIGATLSLATDEEVVSAPKATAVAAGSFELAIEENSGKLQYAKLFTIEPTKGTLATAQQLPVQITYQRPVSSSTPEAAAAHPELVVSQWIQVRVVCTLKGGALWRPIMSTPVAGGAAVKGGAAAASATSSGESDVRVVHLVLRAKIQT